MKYKKVEPKVKEKKNQRREVTWFNPPWSHSVKEPVGALFLRAIDHYFPKSHPLSKIFNRNTLKISYCTTKNLKSIVAAHNRKILNPIQQKPATCNCRNKETCPLQGQCQIAGITYEADVKVKGENDSKVYIGQTCRPFKMRFYEHTMAIKDKTKPQATALSNYIHQLKEEGKEYEIKWSIKSRAPPYINGARQCLLCLREKTDICLTDPKRLLNNRSEMLSKCIHRANYELRKLVKPP